MFPPSDHSEKYTETRSSGEGTHSIESHISEDSPDAPFVIEISSGVVGASNIQLKNIQQENNLIDYTDNHFMSRTQRDLDKVRTSIHHHSDDEPIHSSYLPPIMHPNTIDHSQFVDQDSPITSILGSKFGSRTNSDVDENEDETISHVEDNHPMRSDHDAYTNDAVYGNDQSLSNYSLEHKFKKFRFSDIEKVVYKYYEMDIQQPSSIEIDILITFIKGQKQLYIESKNMTQMNLNALTFPTLFLSAMLTITSPFLSCNPWNLEITSGLNAIVTFFFSLINYLKWETSVQSYSQMASHLENIQTSLELTNSKLILLKNEKEASQIVLKKFNEIETKMNEYKMHNGILIPEEVKSNFPIISYVNIFAFIKKNKMYRTKLIEKLLNVKNEIHYILYKWEKQELGFGSSAQHNHATSIKKEQERQRLAYLYGIKNNVKDEILEFQNTYSIMDDLFTREIKSVEIGKRRFCYFLPTSIMKKPSLTQEYLHNLEPRLAKYFSFLIDDI
jgi:hypothetical protein